MGRTILALLMMGAGLLHFVMPDLYLKAMPPYLPWPRELIFASGLAEVAGGLGLLVPATRQAASYWLIALLIAVFPANVHLALNPPEGLGWAMWLRLPFQIPLIWWAWRAGRPEPGRILSVRE